MNSSTKYPVEYAIAVPSCKGWVCYILRCADDTLYCGISNDLEKRIATHNAGTASKYTRARGPVQLVFVEMCADKSTALKRELTIKGLTREKKLVLISSESQKISTT